MDTWNPKRCLLWWACKSEDQDHISNHASSTSPRWKCHSLWKKKFTTSLTHVVQHYWISKLCQFIKKFVCRCVTCRKVSRKPHKAPDPPPLPNLRLVDLHPFFVTGVDFTDVVHVKTSKGQDKVYIFLVSCASTRAVHLEVLTDLTVSACRGRFRAFSQKSKSKRYQLWRFLSHEVLSFSPKTMFVLVFNFSLNFVNNPGASWNIRNDNARKRHRVDVALVANSYL